jgi:hypothetical protein
MSFNNTRRNYGGVSAAAKVPFCKVCFDAKCSVDEYTSHFVKDQPGPNGKVVCPTLLAQKCLICGVPGHTSSYCPDNSSVSSSSSSLSTIQKEPPPRYALATDEIRHPTHSIRLPPIQKQPQQQQQQQQYSRPAPRIVYANELPSKSTTTTTTTTTTIESVRREFPSLPNLSSLRRFENNEPPALKRELPAAAAAAAASPVHSPIAQPSPKKWTKVKYNKKNNPFGSLDSDDVDSDHETPLPVPVVPSSSSSSSSSSSWASIAAGSKSAVVAAGSKQSQSQSQQQLQQPQQSQQRARSRFSIVVPIAALPPLLPPMSFKPKPVSNSSADLEKKQQVKKLWGDTDSEDDEEFLKRGIN